MKTISLLGTVAALALAGPAMSANLIVNGDFDGGNYTGWNYSFTGPEDTPPVVIAYDQASGYPTGAFGESVPSTGTTGSHGLYFSSDTAVQTLSQIVNVAANTSYALSFDFYVPNNGYTNPNDATLAFLIDGAPAGGLVYEAGSPGGVDAATWLSYSGVWNSGAAAGPVTLAFTFTGGGVTAADFVVDNVSMTAVPEPATWALMIGGFGLAGMQLRRRKANVSFA